MTTASIAGEAKFFVYVHSRLSNGNPFYVGKGRQGRVVMRHGRSDHWNRIVAKEGGRYVNVVYESTDEELAFIIEIELIDKYRRAGVDLINKTDGGEGMSGYRFTPEQSARRSELKRGNTNRLGKKDSEETRARKTAAQRARAVRPKLSEDHKKKIAEGLAKPEVKELLRLASLGKKASDETRSKLSEFQKTRPRASGYKLTDEHKAKVAAAHKNRTQEERDAISKKLSASTTLVWEKRRLNK